MNDFKTLKRSHQKNTIMYFGLIVITVAILTFFLPRGNTYSFQFDVDKPWNNSSLIADFDFPILKSTEDIDREKDSLLRNFVPYFNLDKQVSERMLTRLKEDLKDSLSKGQDKIVEHLTQQLAELYSIGIIDASEYNMMAEDTASHLRIVEANHAITVKLNTLYSTVMAYEKILSDNPEYGIFLHQYNINDYIVPNISYDKKRNEETKQELIASIPLATGIVQNGQKIVEKGELVTKEIHNALISYEKELNAKEGTAKNIYVLLGQILFLLIIINIFFAYLYYFRKDYIDKISNAMMLFVLLVVFPVISYLNVRYHMTNIYVIPFAMAPIFVRLFMDSRTAFITHILIVILCACSIRYPFEFIVVQSVAGFVAIVSLRDLSSRWQLIRSAIYIFIISCVIYFALETMQSGDIYHLEINTYICFLLNSILLLFAYPLMWGIEKLFNFISDVTLVELSNTNNEPLRLLSETAPGTFQHAIQVSNLAAEVANRLQLKAQLCRTGALYHDIGKLVNPAFFVENQSGPNPHEQLSPIESANIVISHVTEGLKIADKYKLPNVIKEFISTHHGQGKCSYFFAEAKKKYGDDFDTLAFTYPGPNPFTREQAIVMMSDACEAASRSLTEYSEKNIAELIEKIINSQMDNGYFKDCPITYRDIQITKTVLTEKLMTIYHTRIKYPD